MAYDQSALSNSVNWLWNKFRNSLKIRAQNRVIEVPFSYKNKIFLPARNDIVRGINLSNSKHNLILDSELAPGIFLLLLIRRLYKALDCLTKLNRYGYTVRAPSITKWMHEEFRKRYLQKPLAVFLQLTFCKLSCWWEKLSRKVNMVFLVHNLNLLSIHQSISIGLLLCFTNQSSGY